MTRRDADTETRLLALANAADQSNRPMALLLMPTLLVAAMLVYAAWSWQGYSKRTTEMENARSRAQSVVTLVAQIESLKAGEVDVTEAFPAQPFFDSNIAEVQSEGGFGFAPPATIGRPENRRVPGLPSGVRLNQVNVSVQLNDALIGDTMRFVDEVLRVDHHSERSFVSSFSVTPLGGREGWRSSIVFSVYASPS